MDESLNPYSPGAGVRPAALVGRDREIRTWQVALERSERLKPTRSVVLHGLRGVGKTVLLREYFTMATERGWYAAVVEANSGVGLREALARALYPAMRELKPHKAGERVRKALSTFKSFAVRIDAAGTWSLGLEVDPTSGRGDSGDLTTDLSELMADLAGAAAEMDRGLAVLVDEAQDLTKDELATLCAVAHQAGQEVWPFLIGLAGLPNLPRVLSEAKSYAERLFSYEPIGRLMDAAPVLALTAPAAAEGVTWDPEAVALVVERAGAYPYFLQEYGQQAWDAAQSSPITVNDAAVGVAAGQAHLDAGFYRIRWDRATPSQRDYLIAMAVDGDQPTLSSAIAQRLGKPLSGVGPARDSLIKKGLIYAPEHGHVAYTVPGMAEFISRQPREEP